MWNKFLASPYTLALLVGVYPLAFYFSNNWFIFAVGRSIFLLGIFALIIFLVLTTYYVGLSWLFRTFFNDGPSRLLQQFYVAGAILALVYLLRHTLKEISGFGLIVSIVLVLMALGLGWISPKKQILHLNSLLFILSILNIGSSIYPMLNTTEASSFIGQGEDESRQKVYDQIRFQKKPNVYYIVPDGYPNQKALKEIYEWDNTKMYQQLETLGFNIQHQAFSNYRSTLPSISALLGMQHHYYRGSVGNFELLYSREFIVSEKNPVVRIFKNNGYQVHYVHEWGMVFAKGCFIDLCSPNSFWGDFIGILLPSRLFRIPVVAEVFGRLPGASMERVLSHINEAYAPPINYFTYIHLNSPSHSPTTAQTREELSKFRQDYFKKIQASNKKITEVVNRILTRDANALIILNADHGGWGFGAFKYAQMKVFEGVPDDVIALDHLGVLLAIRWPESNVPEFNQDIKTNVNLFRYIFAYLSGSQEILTTKVPDHGYLTKGQGKGSILMQVVNDGKILNHMIEIGPVE
jgi:hypothetical protein